MTARPFFQKLFALALLLATTHCIELKSSPFDTSQGGLLGFLTLFARDDGRVRYIAAADAGTVYSSTNGLVWRSTILDSTINFLSAVWSGSKWFLVGGTASACSVYSSSDGLTWTAATLPSCLNRLQAVAASTDGTRIMAVGDPAPTAPAGVVSLDSGSTWNTITTLGTYTYAGLVFANNQFMAFNNPAGAVRVNAAVSDGTTNFALTSNDPQTGAKENTYGAALAIGNRIVHAADEPASMSPDPMNSVTTTDNGATLWTVNPMSNRIFGGNTSDLFPRALAADSAGTTLVAVGDACLVDRTNDLAGLTWTGVQTAMTGCSGIKWQGLIYDGAKYVATGVDGSNAGYFAYSSTGNATDWTIGTLGSVSINHLAIRP